MPSGDGGAIKQRYNHNHGKDGRFTSGNGGGSAAGEASGEAKSSGEGERPVKSRRGRDVTEEYKKNARPGVGSVTKEPGYKQAPGEIAVAELLVEKQGGDIVLLKKKEEKGCFSPDYRWNGRLWDLKSISSEKAADNAVRHGLKQIKEKPGGIILSFGTKHISVTEIKPIIDYRIERSKHYRNTIDVMIIMNGDINKVFRYK